MKDLVDAKLERRRKGIYGPPMGRGLGILPYSTFFARRARAEHSIRVEPDDLLVVHYQSPLVASREVAISAAIHEV